MSTKNTNMLDHLGISLTTALRWLDGITEGPWPDDFPIPKPDGITFDNGASDFKNPAWNIIWNGLCNLIPTKEQLRHHHITNLGRTEEQFEEWWVHQDDKDWSVQKYLKENPEVSPCHFFNLDGSLK